MQCNDMSYITSYFFDTSTNNSPSVAARLGTFNNIPLSRRRHNIATMSLSLLKRSIAIVEEDLSTAKRKKESSTQNSQRSLFDMIPEKQKLYGKYKNARGNQVRYEKLQHKEKLNMEDVKKVSNQKKNKATENLEKLLRLGSNKMNPKITDKILKRVNSKQKLKNEEDKPKEEESIFTEEDFKAFEKEYFNS